MHGPLTQSESVKLGFERGSYNWIVPLHSLHPTSVVESSLFEIGACRWKLVLSRSRRNRFCPEMVTVYLFSSNPNVVLSHIKMSISLHKDYKTLSEVEGQKAAYPFCYVIKSTIPLKDLKEPGRNGQIADELLVSVDFKDIKAVEEVEVPPQLKELMRKIRLEIIDEQSIRQLLNEKNPVLGVVSSERNESYSVYASSSVNLWANQASDRLDYYCRCWLCEKLEDGRMVVKTCLNEANLLEAFEDICSCDNQGIPSLTLFMERIRSTSFQPVSDGSVLVFAKFYDPEYRDLSYLGHWIVQKSMESHTFLEKIVAEKSLFKDDEQYTAYLEKGNNRLEDITNKPGSLEECDIGSGSVVILERMTKPDQLSSQCCHVTSRGILFAEIETPCSSTNNAQRNDHHEVSQWSGRSHLICRRTPLLDHLEEERSLSAPSRDLPEADNFRPRKKWIGRLFKPRTLMAMAKGLGTVAISVGVNLIVRGRLHPPCHENFEDIPKSLGWCDESTNILQEKGFYIALCP